MIHADDCKRPDALPDQISGGRLKCPSCKHVAQAPQPTRARPAGSYVCRDHHDQPVTWRGRGCSTCAAQSRKSEAAKKLKRAAKTTDQPNPTKERS